jgi:hypothetical protein
MVVVGALVTLRSAIAFTLGALILPLAALADDRRPLPKAGGGCPVGYVETGGGAYCKPLASSRGGAIERRGSGCPSGYAASGAFCLPLDDERR